jgi:hypothetical protein
MGEDGCDSGLDSRPGVTDARLPLSQIGDDGCDADDEDEDEDEEHRVRGA